ncbi:hypothetical protein ACQKIE_00975 [Luteibacter sp. NPDC031894]|uniref:hypothetical protein n=1 Tax=Luteibacter sp. NPDC031894 TaxID=3390572 RepID=UPI003D05D167
MAEEFVLALLQGNEILPPHLCAEVEKASGIPCEELRDDLLWFRDGASYPIAYAASIERDDPALAEAAIRNRFQAVSSATPDNTDAAVRDVLATLFGKKEHAPWWGSVALTCWSEPVLAKADTDTLGAIANGAENLMYSIERGIAAGNKMIWSAIQSNWANMSEIADFTYFLSSIGEYAIELRELKSNAKWEIKERAT